MSVRCANCGEELLGAVNRCWRCGHTFEMPRSVSDIPPIRRSPITGPLDRPPGAVDGVVVADLLDAEVVAPDVVAEAVDSGDGTAAAVASTGPTPRRGSPFRRGVPTVRVLTAAAEKVTAVRGSAGELVGDGGAAAGQVAEPSPLATAAGFVALVLVASSLFLYAWPPLLLLVSMLAVPLAAWSISGRNRRFAIVVLLFACLIMAGGIYGTAMWWYTQTYGRSFWQAPSDDEFSE